MTQQRIENTVDIREPSNLKELQSYLGVANYFRDHIKNHSIIVQPMTAMVTEANKMKSKNITWTEIAKASFAKTKEMINACPKLYFINYTAKIILCTDASDYAFGAYLFQMVTEGTSTIEQPIRFMSKSFTGAQIRWSTIEKEAYAIYFALRSMDHIFGGQHFTTRTDHNNLIFLNNAGSKKVLNWKLSIQHLDFDIEHIKGKDNIVPDLFSRLVEPTTTISISTILTAKCDSEQTETIKNCHEFQHAHWGVERTYDRITSLFPDAIKHWLTLHRDVREYVKRCPTCQKMSPVRAVIRATSFVLSHMEPMTRIGMDTIGPLSPSEGFCHIIVIIDHFSRYIELFPSKDVSAKSAANALHRHICRFGVPMELITDQGTQFVNDTLTEYLNVAGVLKIETIPYSKEENSIVERENKEVNRHLRNVIFDTRVIENWIDCIPIIESLFNSTVKAPIGVSPNLIIMGKIKLPEEGILTDFHNYANTTLTARGYLDQLFTRQNDVIDAAQRSQGHINHQVIKQRNERYNLRTNSRKKTVTSINIRCFGEQNSQKWEYDQNTIPPLWKKVTNHNEINQRELLTTESSSTLTGSLNTKMIW